MQPKSWQEVTTQIIALNRADGPALYSLAGASIVGSWNLAGQVSGLLADKTLDKGYETRFVLDEASHSYTCSEQFGSNQSIGIDPDDGAISTEGVKSLFAGKPWHRRRAKKQTASGGSTSADIVTGEFAPDIIKKPVIDILTTAGWSEQKQSAWKRLLSR